jgi:hypothetical protein
MPDHPDPLGSENQRTQEDDVAAPPIAERGYVVTVGIHRRPSLPFVLASPPG